MTFIPAGIIQEEILIVIKFPTRSHARRQSAVYLPKRRRGGEWFSFDGSPPCSLLMLWRVCTYAWWKITLVTVLGWVRSPGDKRGKFDDPGRGDFCTLCHCTYWVGIHSESMQAMNKCAHCFEILPQRSAVERPGVTRDEKLSGVRDRNHRKMVKTVFKNSLPHRRSKGGMEGLSSTKTRIVLPRKII